MSLQTDIIFVKALKSNTELMALLPAGGVYNTSIPVPDEELINAAIPYIIVSFDSLQNDITTKDCSFEGLSDRVQISVEVASKNREQLGELTTTVRSTIRDFFSSMEEGDDDYDLLPYDYTFSAGAVTYDPDKPAYGQILTYLCDTKID